MFFNWSIIDIWQISFEKWKPIDIRESTYTVSWINSSKLLFQKKIMLSGMYMYSFLWFEFNHWFGSIYKNQDSLNFCVHTGDSCQDVKVLNGRQ